MPCHLTTGQCCCACRFRLTDYKHCLVHGRGLGGCVCSEVKGFVCAGGAPDGRVHLKWPEHSAGCELYQPRELRGEDEAMSEQDHPPETATEVFTPEEVANLHRHQFGPFDPPMTGGFQRMHPFTCPNRGDGRHFDNGSDLGALIPTVRGWICQCCDYTQGWAHGFMKDGR